MDYVVNLTWDADALVWVATSEDIPGLVLESGSFDAIVERIRIAAPEMLKLNGTTQNAMNLTFKSTRQERIAING